MKTIIMIIGALFLGAMAYYGYTYGVEKSEEASMQNSSDEVVDKVKSVMTEVVEEEFIDEKAESDIAVKSSIEEDIPVEEEMEEVPDEEALIEEDIIENEESGDINDSEDIDMIIEQQEALMDEAVNNDTTSENKEDIVQLEKFRLEKEQLAKEEFYKKEVIPEQANKKNDDEVQADKNVPILETEEEKIIREEEEKNKAAMEEDNVSE